MNVEQQFQAVIYEGNGICDIRALDVFAAMYFAL
jgi:hypothetical protein